MGKDLVAEAHLKLQNALDNGTKLVIEGADYREFIFTQTATLNSNSKLKHCDFSGNDTVRHLLANAQALTLNGSKFIGCNFNPDKAAVVRTASGVAHALKKADFSNSDLRRYSFDNAIVDLEGAKFDNAQK